MDPTMSAPRTRAAAALARALSVALAASVALASGCARDRKVRDSSVSRAQADKYIRDAVRQSSEGVVLEPSQRGIDPLERARLGEIAQQLRRPAAICFLERAITTMEPGEVDGEAGWVDVPEGQIKVRARVGVDGKVLAAESLESGFEDESMAPCLEQVIAGQRFPPSRDGFAYHVDVYYWVSLGFFREATTDEFAKWMRRQQAEAGVRAKQCLVGRVGPGDYEVAGLNLFDREGRTVINRVERGELPPEVSSCVAAAFKQIRIRPEPDAFVRPAAPAVEFTVAEDGTVRVGDERWLKLIELEEQAERERKQAELLGRPIGEPAVEADGLETGGVPAALELGAQVPTGRSRPTAPRRDDSESRDGPGEGRPDGQQGGDRSNDAPAGEPSGEGPGPRDEPRDEPEPGPEPREDGADEDRQGGIKLDLSPRR